MNPYFLHLEYLTWGNSQTSIRLRNAVSLSRCSTHTPFGNPAIPQRAGPEALRPSITAGLPLFGRMVVTVLSGGPCGPHVRVRCDYMRQSGANAAYAGSDSVSNLYPLFSLSIQDGTPLAYN